MGKKENEIGGNDEVCTPPSIYEPVLKALGRKRFDLDPCSHPDAIVPAVDRYMLPRYKRQCARRRIRDRIVFTDSLDVTWEKQLVWLNPPYSQLRYPKKYLWLHKLAYEAKQGVAFLPSRTSSRWWHEGILNCEPAQILVQLKGRVTHVGMEWGSPFHQVLVGYNVGKSVNALRQWRKAFGHPDKAFVSSLVEMRAPA